MKEEKKRAARYKKNAEGDKRPVLLTVDRTEGSVVVCEAGDGTRRELPVYAFEERPKDGTVILWTGEKAVPDLEATRVRKRKMKERLSALRNKH